MKQKTKKKRTTLEKMGIFVFYSMLIPIGFLLLKIFQMEEGYTDPLTHRSRGDYVLMIIQCVLGMIALIIPKFIQEKKKLQIQHLNQNRLLMHFQMVEIVQHCVQ